MITGILTIDVGGEEVLLDVDALLHVDGENLTEEYATQASLMAYMGVLTAQAEAMWQEAKNETARVRAMMDGAARTGLVAANQKATVDRVKAEIELQPKVREAMADELDYLEQYHILRAVTNAVKQRGDMLVSLGAHLRAEADQTGMLIRRTKDTMNRLRDASDEREPPF